MVTRMTIARGMNGGKGFSRAYVYECLRGTRNNEAICALYEEVQALTTPTAKARKRNTVKA